MVSDLVLSYNPYACNALVVVRVVVVQGGIVVIEGHVRELMICGVRLSKY